MKSIITITYKKINGLDVDKKMLESIPLLKISTQRTQKLLCKNIEKYFRDNKIIVKAKGELIYE